MKENDSPIAALPQETSSAGEEVKGSSGSPPTRKSLIPVRTPPKVRNTLLQLAPG